MFLTLNEYMKLAQIVLKRRASNLMDNEDAIAYVARYAMRADSIFDGRGSRDGFRYQHADFGARSFLRSYLNEKKDSPLSLDYSISENNTLGDTVGSTKYDPAITMENNELVDKILSSSVLSNTQRKYIYSYFIESMSMQEIATKNEVSRQAVHDSISNGIAKLRRAFNNE